MNKSEIRSLIEERIAFVKKVGVCLEEASATEARLLLPLKPCNLNPQGLVHAGASFTLAEAAAEALGLAAFDPQHFTFIAKMATMRFRRPVRGDVWARAQLAHDTLQASLERASSEGKADVPIPVELTDQAGERLAEAEVTLSLRRL